MKRFVSVPEQQQSSLLLLSSLTGIEQGLFDPSGMAVTQKNAHSLNFDASLLRGVGVKVTVSGHLYQLNCRKLGLQLLGITPAIPQMDDHTGRDLLNRLHQSIKLPVRIRSYQNLHSAILSVCMDSIRLFLPLYNKTIVNKCTINIYYIIKVTNYIIITHFKSIYGVAERYFAMG